MSGPVTESDRARVDAVAAATGHSFSDIHLLRRCCTHASRVGAQADARQRLAEANERLEFLGDALLGAALCLTLYRRHVDADEGVLSRLKSHLASRSTLARVGEDSGVFAHCLVGQQMGALWPDSIKANLVEGMLAGIFLDGGWPALVTAIERLFAARCDALREDDAKTRLQAWALEHHGALPAYNTTRDGGSDHAPTFVSNVSVGARQAEGHGTSRRRAEIAAAEDLLTQLDTQPST